jgi:NitT/TauT family transport system permease protein
MRKEITRLNIIKVRSLFTTIISTLAWLFLWELCAYLLDIRFFFPGAIETFITFSKLVCTFTFWKTVSLSMLRILLGLFLGVISGIILAITYNYVYLLRSFISVGMTVIKSTPVASVIMVMWVIIGSANLPIAIALLIVTPVVWQNLCDGFSSIDKSLAEVCEIFEFSKMKKIKILILPQLTKYFIPAFLTSIGLAWKSGIAAEIISYTKNSIGKNIFDSKNYFEGDVMFAWTICVVILSLLLENFIKILIKKARINYVKSSY